MSDIVERMLEVEAFCREVMARTKDWDDNTFLAMIGLIVDWQAARMGEDAADVWQVLHDAAVTVNGELGPALGPADEWRA